MNQPTPINKTKALNQARNLVNALTKKSKKNKRKPRKDRIIKSNLLSTTGFSTTNLKSAGKVESIVIEHTEAMGSNFNVPGSVAFSVTEIPINPGLDVFGSWISKQAVNWEQYIIEYIEFNYKPIVNVFSPNGVGTVALFFDTNPNDIPPESFKDILDSQLMSTDIPSNNITLRVDKKYFALPKYFIRQGPQIGDIKTYDPGVLYIATQNQASTAICGFLTMKYKLKLMIPVQEGFDAVKNVRCSQYVGNQTLVSGTPTDLNLSVPYSINNAVYNGLGLTRTGPAINVQPGNYLINVHHAYATSGGANLDEFVSYIYYGANLQGPGIRATSEGDYGTFSQQLFLNIPVATALSVQTLCVTSGAVNTAVVSMFTILLV